MTCDFAEVLTKLFFWDVHDAELPGHHTSSTVPKCRIPGCWRRMARVGDLGFSRGRIGLSKRAPIVDFVPSSRRWLEEKGNAAETIQAAGADEGPDLGLGFSAVLEGTGEGLYEFDDVGGVEGFAVVAGDADEKRLDERQLDTEA